MPKAGDNIYQRKDGRWEGRYIKGREGGKVKHGYVFGKTREEAKSKRDAAIAALQAGLPAIPNSSSPTPGSFHAFSDEWLRFLTPQLKLSSVNKYTNVLNSYLIPEFGNIQMTEISRNLVSSLIVRLLCSGGSKSAGLSPGTVNSIYSVLKNVFDYASREKNIRVADIRDIPIKQPQKQMRILSLAEQMRLSQYLREHMNPCHLGILVCMYTGLRLGEICALKWQDIAINEQMLCVNRAMQRVQHLGSSGKRTEIQISIPKSNCSIRRIPLPDELFQVLLSEKRVNEAFLLTGSETKYVEPRTMQNHFRSVLEECEIEDANFHALRHTFATRCVELGFDVKSLSEILGHANVNITMNRYVHPSMELKQKNMNMLSDFLTVRNLV